MNGEGSEMSVPSPGQDVRRAPDLGLSAEELSAIPLAFPGPDLVIDSHRLSLVWPGLTLILAAASVVFAPIILGPLAIITGLIAVSRAERFARIALALAVIGMLSGFLYGALVLHHHHGTLISKVTFL